MNRRPVHLMIKRFSHAIWIVRQRVGAAGCPTSRRARGFSDFVESNVEAETLGYHRASSREHHFTGFGQISATLTLLTCIAARTTSLRLGTAVMVLPWHNPVLLAEQAATLDLLSGGRLDLGVGKGYRHNEFAGFAMPPEEAEARFEEVLDVIVRASTSNEPFSHHGRYWRFDDIVVEPPPPSGRTRRCGWPPAVDSSITAVRAARLQSAARPVRVAAADRRAHRALPA